MEDLFLVIMPADLPKSLSGWLMGVIQDNDPFEHIDCFKHRDKPEFAFWFKGSTFENLLDHIKSFPKSYRLYQVALTGGNVHFHCNRK